jgi:hypothetical protein
MFKGSKSLWNVDYVVPNLPDGNYEIYFTATDTVGNQMTTSTNFTVDNTPPTITARITPNKLKYIDFSRPMVSIIAQSSSDAKEIHSYLEDGSKGNLNYSNDHWMGQLNFPYLIPLGTYDVKLRVYDYAGNEGETTVMYYVYKNLNVKNPLTKPSEPGSLNNEPVDGSLSTESSIGGSNDVTTGSSDASTDDPAGTDGSFFLKLLLEVLLILDDLLTILFFFSVASLFIWAFLAVLGLLGFFTGLFVLFAIVVIVIGVFLVIFAIYKLYNR